MVQSQAINISRRRREAMSNLFQLRIAAREIFDEAVRAVDAGDAVRRAVRKRGKTLHIGEAQIDLENRKVYVIALGKAKFPFFDLEEQLGESFAAGFFSAPFPGFGVTDKEMVETKLRTRWRWCQGGHPLPTKSSLLAAEEAFALLNQANEERGLVIFLVSGGGSAMMEWPIDDSITLANLRIANKVLVKCGASISEINAVRCAFSAVKGGRLAGRTPNCEQITLIISDVPKGEEHNVASGPTFPPSTDTASAAEVVARYDLRDKLPAPILRAIDNAATLAEPKRHDHFVLLDNDTALEAAASAGRKRGFSAQIARDISDEEIETGCQNLLTRLGDLQSSVNRTNEAAFCLISGGEFACPVRGDGIGGRNLETALRLAIAADQNSERIGEFVALCAGTDGLDGNSPVAGAIVDSTTIQRARRIGLNTSDFLNRSDSYSFFVALGDAITTGPTGTNVRDLRILLRHVSEPRRIGVATGS